MSGPNSATAAAAYARTRERLVAEGDLVMIHADTCADGYWTDLTRTYTAGDPSQRQNDIRIAIDAARAAGLSAIHPHATGQEVDRAARDVMKSHGFGSAFKHATGGKDPLALGANNCGKGVGGGSVHWAASTPRLHPSDFEVYTRDGVGADWPITYQDIQPYYEQLELEMPARHAQPSFTASWLCGRFEGRITRDSFLPHWPLP